MAKANLEVATTILEQLGGAGRLSAMLGAHSFVGGDDCLVFQFKARAARSINRVMVKLDPSDTYSVSFYKGRGVNVAKVSECSDVYVDALRSTIESITGLHLSL